MTGGILNPGQTEWKLPYSLYAADAVLLAIFEEELDRMLGPFDCL